MGLVAAAMVALSTGCVAMRSPDAESAAKAETRRETTCYFAGQLDESYATWYYRHLFAFGEKPLWAGANPATVRYRFTYLPSFEHPVCIRLERTGTGTPRLWIREHAGFGGYPAEDLMLVDEARLLSEEELK